ncbi:hypothetical protein [Cellulomonas hominis]
MTPPGPTPDLPPDRPLAGRVLDARLHLLDRQVLDADGVPVTTVDDLEMTGLDGAQWPTGEETAVIAALLSGPVLATRIFGGRPPRSHWHRIGWRDVSAVGTALRLGVRSADLDVTWTERWVRDHVLSHVPGGRHDPGRPS